MNIGGAARTEHGEFRLLFLMAGFMAVVGAFGTSMAPMLVRLPYWFTVLLIGGTLLLSTRFYLEQRWGRQLAGYWSDLIATVVTAPLIALVVILASRIAFSTEVRGNRLVGLLPAVVVVSVTLLMLRRVQVRGETATPIQPDSADAPPGRFQDRLPFRMRSARIVAIEADDHYLRVFTDVGQAYLHMRLSDAVAELIESDGMRVHRSRWVARSAIASARWRHGRGTLCLLDGSTVPVSRTYAPAVRPLI